MLRWSRPCVRARAWGKLWAVSTDPAWANRASKHKTRANARIMFARRMFGGKIMFNGSDISDAEKVQLRTGETTMSKNLQTTIEKKPSTKKSSTPPDEKKPELVAGQFKSTSVAGKTILLMKDGRARTMDEIAKIVKPDSPKNLINHINRGIRPYGEKSKLYTWTKTEDGKRFQLTFHK